MRRSLDSRLVIAIYTWCRQAERSIDRTLLGSEVWLPFTEYYDHRKRAGLCAALEELRARCQTFVSSWGRDQILVVSVMGKTRSFYDRLANRFRSHWWFAQRELAFFCQTLDKFSKLLNERERPPVSDVVAMRMDLHACQWAIRNRVGDIPALAKAERVENFRQPSFLTHVSLQELGLVPAEQRVGISPE